MAGRFGAILSSLSLAAGQSVRRNAGDSAFEAYTPFNSASDTLPYTQVNNLATARLVGRSTAGTGALEAISIGSGLSLSAGTLSATGGGITIGNAVSGGGANRVLYEDGSQNLAASANFTFASDVLTVNSQAISAGAAVARDSLFFGKTVGNATHTSVSNIGIGTSVLTALTGGYRNIGIGTGTLNACGDGFNNVGIGTNALAGVTSAGGNVAIGYLALATTSTNGNNTALGVSAGEFATGSNCFYLGMQSGRGASAGTPNSGSNQVGIGVNSLYSNSTGANNIGIGYLALFANTTGSQNVAIGMSALEDASVSDCTAIGAYALRNVTSGGNNVGIGRQAGDTVTTGARNLYLGSYAGFSHTGSDSVMVGYQAGYSETGSNKLYISNSTTSTPLIYGEFDNKVLYFTGQEIRQRYDASNYFKTTVGSTGGVTFDAVGSGAKFTFSDAISFPLGGAISGGGANRVLYEDGSQNLAASANLTFDGTNLILGNSGKRLEIGLDSSYNAIFGHAYSASDNVLQYQFKYYSGGGNGTKGIALMDTAYGYTTVLVASASGQLYWVDGSGSPGSLLVGSWFNPNDGAEMRARYGAWEVRSGAFSVNNPWQGNATFEVLGTADQMRIQYDASNYYKTTVGSTGAVTFDAVGSGAKFIFSDCIEPPSMADSSAPNNSIYYSTTASKLVYKDSGGVVNNLY